MSPSTAQYFTNDEPNIDANTKLLEEYDSNAEPEEGVGGAQAQVSQLPASFKYALHALCIITILTNIAIVLSALNKDGKTDLLVPLVNLPTPDVEIGLQ